METEVQLIKDIEAVLDAETNNFLVLAEMIGLDPAKDFVDFDLSGVDFRECDLTDVNLTDAVLSGAIFDSSCNLTQERKEDFIRRGAIFLE